MPKPPTNSKRIAKLAAIFTAGRDSGLSSAQREVMADLGVHPGSTYPQISKRTGINPQTLRGYMASLRKAGYVARSMQEENIVIVEFSLTAAGIQLLEKIAAAA
jgi:DNA-binding MarR family transcriptional regulator